MSEKKPGSYKTESELKEEAKIRLEKEAELLASRPKTDKQKKRENFWYHYKLHTIIGVLAVVIAAFFIKDTIFSKKPDATIIMSARQYYSIENIEELTSAIEKVAADFNGDGKISITIDYIMLPDENSESAGQQDYAMTMKFFAVTAAGIDPIYLLDDAVYRHMLTMSAGEGENPEPAAIFAPESAPVDFLEFENPDTKTEFEGLRFYLRTSASDAKYYEYCADLFKVLNRS